MVCYSTLATSTKAGNHFNLRHMWGHWRGWELLCHLQADCHICLPTLLNAKCQRQKKVFSSLWTFSLFVVKLSAVHLSTSWTWSNIAKLNQTNFFILKLSYYTHTTSMFMSSHINRWLFKKRILTKGIVIVVSTLVREACAPEAGLGWWPLVGASDCGIVPVAVAPPRPNSTHVLD